MSKNTNDETHKSLSPELALEQAYNELKNIESRIRFGMDYTEAILIADQSESEKAKDAFQVLKGHVSALTQLLEIMKSDVERFKTDTN